MTYTPPTKDSSFSLQKTGRFPPSRFGTQLKRTGLMGFRAKDSIGMVPASAKGTQRTRSLNKQHNERKEKRRRVINLIHELVPWSYANLAPVESVSIGRGKFLTYKLMLCRLLGVVVAAAAAASTTVGCFMDDFYLKASHSKCTMT